MARSLVSLIVAIALLMAAPASAQVRRVVVNGVALGGGGGNVQLPVVSPDFQGATWQLYNAVNLQQNGNNPPFSNTAIVTVNSQGLAIRSNNARQDEKTGEYVFDGISVSGLSLSRRYSFGKDDGSARVVDVYRNPTAKPITASVMVNANFNFGTPQARTIADPRRKDAALGFVSATANGRAIAVAFAAVGGKLAPVISYQPGNSMVSATYALTIPANKEVAISTAYLSADNVAAAEQLITSPRAQRLTAGLSREIRKLIINAGSPTSLPDDIEIIRGDAIDILETRGGDQLKGTLTDRVWTLETGYGVVELPADRVVALVSVGQFRPRQLIVTADGELFGGRLKTEAVTLELSGGQTVRVPLSQVARAGYRRRPGEPEDWPLDKPMVVLRSGDRMVITPPAGPLTVATRYGALSLPRSAVASVALRTEDSAVHRVTLADGSRFSGLLADESFTLTLAGAAGERQLTLPATAVARLQFSAPAEPTDDDPLVRLANDDALVGALDGKLTLDTAFDAIDVDAAQIRGLRRAATGTGGEIQVTLWDGTVVTGQPRTAAIAVRLRSGPTVNVPLDLIEEYAQPKPAAPASAIARIKKLVDELNADDFRARETAQAQLVAAGPSIATVLRELKADAPPEARQRIDAILTTLGEKRDDDPAKTPPAAPAGAVPNP